VEKVVFQQQDDRLSVGQRLLLPPISSSISVEIIVEEFCVAALEAAPAHQPFPLFRTQAQHKHDIIIRRQACLQIISGN